MVAPVVVETSGAVAWLTLNRPERLNAVSQELYVLLLEALLEAEVDAGVRIVVLRGAGRGFCAGADLKEYAAGRRGPDERRAYVELGQGACRRIQLLPKPVIAQVHGFALGAGMEIALSADFLLVAGDARLGFPEVSLATSVGGGITRRLPQLVGLMRAKELILLGRRFSGLDAAAWGLAFQALPAERLPAATETLAGQLAAMAPVSMGFAKAQLEAAFSQDLDEALVSEAGALNACMETNDWTEGVAAFAGRRSPVFHGR